MSRQHAKLRAMEREGARPAMWQQATLSLIGTWSSSARGHWKTQAATSRADAGQRPQWPQAYKPQMTSAGQVFGGAMCIASVSQYACKPAPRGE